MQAMGGAVAAVESGYMKQALVSSHAARRGRIESGEEMVVGVNSFETTEASPLTADLDAAIQAADPEAERAALAVAAGVARRSATQAEVDAGAGRPGRGREVRRQPDGGDPGRGAGRCDHRGVGRRAARGVRRVPRPDRRVRRGRRRPRPAAELAAVRDAVRATGEELGSRLRLLVGKPGLDGHSNGAEQVAVRARDAGFEVIYQGIRLTPEQIVAAAVAEDVHCVGLSILSGSHMELVPAVLDGLRAQGLEDVPVVVGGIIPSADAARLKELGVAAVFTPKDFGLTEIMARHPRGDPPGERPGLTG